ncbi:remorin-like [Aristolochia californica]|uniref:remorin-like n=1 Tax=Aristolochia californica TaxID=171875 RepID=UPI0035DE0624
MKKPEAADKKKPQKIPTTQKVPSFPEKEDGMFSIKQTSAKDTRPLPATKPATPTNSNQQKERLKEKDKMETQADTWERIKLAKNQKSYEKEELETKRANTSHEYHMEIARIEKISGEARADAEENKRNDEKKAKEKAKRFRSTGKPPVTCFFF